MLYLSLLFSLETQEQDNGKIFIGKLRAENYKLNVVMKNAKL